MIGGLKMVKISDLPGPQNFRDKRSEDLVNEVTGYMRINTGDNVVDFGSGQGEIPKEMAKLGCLITCIDLFTLPSRKVNESKVRGNLTWISGDATKKIDFLKDNSVDLVTMFYFLQVLDEENGRIVIVDEIPREFWGFWDVIVHYGLNLVEKSKEYNILKSGEYEKLFSEAGLEVTTKCISGKHALYVLKKIE